MVRQTVFVGLRVLLVFLHVLVVQTFDLKHIDRDPSLVTVTSPLRVLQNQSAFDLNSHSGIDSPPVEPFHMLPRRNGHIAPPLVALSAISRGR